MRYFILLFWLTIFILGITFSSFNSHFIKINYFFASSEIYFPLLLIIILAMGAFLGILAILPVLIKSKQMHWKLKSHIRQIEVEIKNLRTIPIKDTHH